MKAVYLDASAFVKVVVAEPESRALLRFLRSAPARRVSSSLLRTEAMRSVRHLGSRELERARDRVKRIDLVAIDDRILDAAGLLDPGVMRTLDAIHLATALAIGDDLEAVVSYDERMLEAARLLGLPALAPR